MTWELALALTGGVAAWSYAIVSWRRMKPREDEPRLWSASDQKKLEKLEATLIGLEDAAAAAVLTDPTILCSECDCMMEQRGDAFLCGGCGRIAGGRMSL